MITQGDLKKDGFQLVRGLVPTALTDEVVKGISSSVAQQLTYLEIDSDEELHSAMKTLFNADLERYKKTVSAIWRRTEVYALLHHPVIVEFVSEILATDDLFIAGGQVVHIMSDELRVPGGYFGFKAHQDFPSVRGSLDGVLVWVALTDIDESNYPVEVIPRSHLHGLFPTVADSRNEIRSEFIEESEFIPISCNVGDVLILDNHLVHRSSVQGDGRLRLACSVRYDNGTEATYIQRGYPTAYTRSVDRMSISQHHMVSNTDSGGSD